MIKQFVPQEVCLKCLGCCRFAKADSVWSPCLLEEEIQDFLDKKIPPAAISLERKILLVPNPKEEGYLCPFLELSGNKCKIYSFRPLECQLYPFLINLRRGKILLTIDLNCPYAKENLNTKECKEYIEYLTSYLNSPEQLELLKDNPQILQAYEDVREVVELNPLDETK